MFHKLRILMLLVVLVISLFIGSITQESYTQQEIKDILQKDEKIQQMITAK